MTQKRPDGSLEQEVLLQLWALGRPATSSEVLERLDEDLAYTTVMTVLTRLWQKGFVNRIPQGRAFAYEPAITEAELTARRMHDSLSGATDPKAALVSFVDDLSPSQVKALRMMLGEADSRRRK